MYALSTVCVSRVRPGVVSGHDTSHSFVCIPCTDICLLPCVELITACRVLTTVYKELTTEIFDLRTERTHSLQFDFTSDSPFLCRVHTTVLTNTSSLHVPLVLCEKSLIFF